MSKYRLSLRQKQSYAGYLFILPWIIGFIFLFLYPLAQSVVFSLNKITITTTGYTMDFAGVAHYKEALYVHADFNRILTGSIMKMIGDVPLILVFSLFAAMLINRPFFGRTLSRAIFFLPVILTSGIILRMLEQDWMNAIMQAGMGENTFDGLGLQTVNLKRYLLESGLDPYFVGYIIGAVDRIYDIIHSSGVQILVFLAGLQSVSHTLYEAAYMEGATRWEAFWKITFPLVSPFILANAIYTVIDSFTSNDNLTMRLVHSTAFSQQQLSLSAAMAWIYFAAIIAILGATIALVSKKIFYQES